MLWNKKSINGIGDIVTMFAYGMGGDQKHYYQLKKLPLI